MEDYNRHVELIENIWLLQNEHVATRKLLVKPWIGLTALQFVGIAYFILSPIWLN